MPGALADQRDEMFSMFALGGHHRSMKISRCKKILLQRWYTIAGALNAFSVAGGYVSRLEWNPCNNSVKVRGYPAHFDNFFQRSVTWHREWNMIKLGNIKLKGIMLKWVATSFGNVTLLLLESIWDSFYFKTKNSGWGWKVCNRISSPLQFIKTNITLSDLRKLRLKIDIYIFVYRLKDPHQLDVGPERMVQCTKCVLRIHHSLTKYV